MENATKALLIAASVLIAIVLIAVGINILSSTSGVTNQVDSVSQSMAQSIFNSQFTPYLGNSVSGTQAKALVQKILANNTNSDNIVNVNFYPSSGTSYAHKTSSADLQTIVNQISTSGRYKITPTTGCSLSNDGYKNGYLACINIKEV